ncbi:hypothetical protein B0H21DRAFT_826044 [Amylocystis lapponica]|nr:hypothetical protein B0H21DRAFT_826044 [Amylocystis lapponica]
MPIIPSRRSAPEPTKSGRQKALLVGINYSTQTSQVESDYERLYAPGRDALAFRDLLIRLYGYRDVDITVMVDEADDRRLRPTRANIIDALVKERKLGIVCVLLCWHSDQIASKSISEEDGLDEVIVPMDYNDSNSIVDNARVVPTHL